MAALDPLTIAALGLGFLAYATVVGNPIRRLLLSPNVLEGQSTNIPIRWVTSVMTGLAVIPLVYLTLGLVPGWAGPGPAWGLLLGTGVWNVVLYRRDLPRLPEKWRQLRRTLCLYDRAFILLFVVVLIFHLSPLIGLWTTPGDDAKLYSLITRRFVETGGTPQTWGVFADPSWYVERTHLLLPGFSSVAASVVYLFGTEIPATVSVVTSVFRILPVATLYVLATAVFRRKLAAVLAAALYGLMILEPTLAWFQWGGNAELSGLSLLPLAVAATYVLYEGKSSSPRTFAWLAIVLGGMTLLHPFVFFYFLAFLVPLTVLILWERRWSRLAGIWFPVVLGLGLAALPILHALGPETSISAEYSVFNIAWTPVASWSMTPSTIAGNILSRMMNVYGPAVVSLLFLALVLSRGLLRAERKALFVLGLWVAGLFFLHENNPNGLWLVPFPLWYRIDGNRTFDATSFIAASVAGLVLERASRWISPPLLGSGKYSMRRLLKWVRSDRRKLAALAALVIIVAGQLVANAALAYGSRAFSPVTADDIAAFAWIQQHSPSTATFFVNWADAGTWIPDFANRRVVMPFGVVTNYSLLDAYNRALTRFASNASDAASIGFMQSLKATYVYAGSARIFGRQGFDPVRILSSGLFDTAYHGNSVWIFTLNESRLSVVTAGWPTATESAEFADSQAWSLEACR